MKMTKENCELSGRIESDLTKCIIKEILNCKPGQNKIFSEAAIALTVSVMPAIQDLSALGELEISKDVICQVTRYTEYVRLVENPKISQSSKTVMLSYLNSRAGFDLSKPLINQPEDLTRFWALTHNFLNLACLRWRFRKM